MLAARPFARQFARPFGRKLAGMFSGSGVGAWLPSALGSNLLQNFGSPLTYSATKIAGLPVIPSTVGTLAQPRGQRCCLFDGVNDYATTSGLAFDLTQDWTAVVRFRSADYGSVDLIGFGSTIASTGISLSTYTNFIYIYGTVYPPQTFTFVNGVAYEMACVKTGMSIAVYIDGTLIQTLTISSTALTTSTEMAVGAISYSGNGDYQRGVKYISDVRLYSVAKTAPEILAIYNQHLTPDVIDTAGAVVICPMQEEAGTVHYNIVNIAKNLTATNVTTATYHAVDASVKYSFANELGYTLSGATVIPRNESNPTHDCAGNALQYAGPIGLPATMEVPYLLLNRATGPTSVTLKDANFTTDGTFAICLKSDGISTSIDTLLGDWHPYSDGNLYVSWLRSVRPALSIPGKDTSQWHWFIVTSTPGTNGWNLYWNNELISTQAGDATISCPTLLAGGANNYGELSVADAIAWNRALSQAEVTALVAGSIPSGFSARHRFQEGSGASNTNRDLHWFSDAGTGGKLANTIVGGTVSTFWANRTNVSRDACIENGGGIDGYAGAFVVGVPGSANDASGIPKLFQAGEHRNPYSRFVPNQFDAPSLVNIGSTSGDKYGPTDGVQLERIADTRFRKPGFSKYFASLTALTGSDKTSAESNVGVPSKTLPVSVPISMLYDALQESYANNAPVAQWSDRSGNARHATAASAIPVFKERANGNYPAIYFDGSKGLARSYTGSGSSYVIGGIVALDSLAAFRIIWHNGFLPFFGVTAGGTPIAYNGTGIDCASNVWKNNSPLGFAVSGTTARVFVGKTEIGRGTIGSSPLALAGLGNYPGYEWQGHMQLILGAEVLPSDADIANVMDYLTYQASQEDLPIVSFKGDSITSGLGPLYNVPYPTILNAMFGGTRRMINNGVSGQTIVDLGGPAGFARSNFAEQMLRHGRRIDGKRNVAVIFMGTNDVYYGASAASTATEFLSLCADAKAAGQYVIAVDMIDHGINGSWTKQKQIDFNAAVWAGNSNYDAIYKASLDFDDNTGPLFLDTTHPTTAGNILIASRLKPLIEAAT